MRVALVHNPTSGRGEVDPERLRRRVEDAGHQIAYTSADAPGWGRLAHADVDLVVAAGGDGTVGDVLLAVEDRPVPVTPLALGTANNIARTLGVPSDDPLSWIEGWAEGRRSGYDVLHVRSGSTDVPAVESVGGGVFASAIHRAEEEGDPDGLDARLRLLQRTVATGDARRWTIILDGEDLSGEYLSVEALNIRTAGPGVLMAPDAEPGDGLLHLVLVRPEDREAIIEHIEGHIAGPGAVPLELPGRPGRDLLLEAPEGAHAHVDDELVEDLFDQPGGQPVRRLEVRVGDDRRTVLVPGG